ncbi:serine hydrolase domain-containing protein [Actinoallomurus soli]|uniref:serine hydrolase domain-containing protein n=1 Tax=Actinoallomurus soli TaxID=2952535 RepID=UPI0020933B1D|nr:serine hydrolase domain-containing protein [Actinoallomurus soli]MCO5970661.1 beta-lactamase family protein [Actinoallomurus soli]
MKRLVFAPLVLFAALLPVSAPTPVQATPATRRTAIQAALNQIVAAGAPGALAEASDEDGRWAGASGVGDLRTRTPMPATGRWRIGSVTKTFTATLILQLIGERKLGLDEPIDRYLPGLLPRGGQITVRMLLDHTSGLADYSASFDDTPEGFRRLARTTYTPRQLIDLGTSMPPTSRPGGPWHYSNTGYIALGLLAEKITGQPLGYALRRRISIPHRLSDTWLPITNPAIGGTHPRGYTTDERGHPEDITRFNPSNAWAAGAIVSTAADLNRFFTLLLQGRLFPVSLLNQMQRTVPGPGLDYGLGLVKLTLPCGAVWGHMGHIPGYVTYSFHTRQRHLTVTANALHATNDQAVDAGLRQALNAEFCTT